LIKEGQGVLDWEIDGPTMYGIEPDQAYAAGQFGVTGVALHRLKDVEELCRGLPLDEISISSDSLHPHIFQSYILTAKKRGIPLEKLRGIGGAIFWYVTTVIPSYSEVLYLKGSDISSLGRWGNDFMEYVLRNCPKWNLWYVSAYDFREAGGDAIEEIAFTIAIRDEILEEMKRRGIDVGYVASRLSPVLGADRDFFEEIAKMRAARRVWARTMKEKWKTTSQAAMTMRFHVDVSGVNYTMQQPRVNLVRGTLGTLSAVLGGAMGIQTPSYDEAYWTPTEEAVRLAIRTQQVIRYESGVPRVADPLGGSYYVEWLTKELEGKIMKMVGEIEEMGGWIAALDRGWVHNRLKRGLLDIQRKIERGERTVIGVNKLVIPKEDDFKPSVYRPGVSEVKEYLDEYGEWKKRRDKQKLMEVLEKLRHAAEHTDENLVPYVFSALEADATFAEIIGVLRMVDGLEYDWAGEREYPF
jgi:methylmalonyl-CoA mutase N-terminal domain/subunit